MSKSTKPFDASRLKLKRALDHIEALDKSIAKYFSTDDWYKCTFDSDANGNKHLRVVIRGQPRDIDLIVGDAVHNMRAALDLLAVELVGINGGNTNGVYFPFCKDSTELDEMIKSKNFHRASAAAQDRVRALKPYKGGNVSLRALHDLDIQDKHHTLIPTACAITTPPVSVALDENGVPKGLAEGRLELVADLNQRPTVVWTFPDDSPLAGQPIAPSLRGLLKLVSEIVDSFEALTA